MNGASLIAQLVKNPPARIASLCPMQDTACLGLVHGDDPERCYGEGGGSGVHVWKRMYTRGGFMSMYGKTNTVL